VDKKRDRRRRSAAEVREENEQPIRSREDDIDRAQGLLAGFDLPPDIERDDEREIA
jgi:hypothetical protein